LFTSADGTHYVPANTSSSTNATSSRTVNQTPIDPFGHIVYYGYTTAIEANARPGASYLWIIYTLSLGYSFNKTGAALTLDDWAPVYLKCAPQANGSAIIDEDTPYVQALPTTADGKIYIFLGVAYNATSIELLNNHPVYYHDGTGIRIWTGKNIPSKTSELTNDSGFITSQRTLINMGYSAGNLVFTDVDNNTLTHAQVISILHDTTKDVVITNNFSDTDNPEYVQLRLYQTIDEGNDCYTYRFCSIDVNTSRWFYFALFEDDGVLSLDEVYYDGLATTSSLATVATSGSYDDLTDKPTIPAAIAVDSTITQNGTNPVQGGAIYSALAGKEDRQRVIIDIQCEVNYIIGYSVGGNTITGAELYALCADPKKDVVLRIIGYDANEDDDVDYSDDILYHCINDSLSEYEEQYFASWWNGMILLVGLVIESEGANIYFDAGIEEFSYVPTYRKINNKPLSTDITLTASDVGALPSTTTIPTVPTNVSSFTNDAGYLTSH